MRLEEVGRGGEEVPVLEAPAVAVGVTVAVTAPVYVHVLVAVHVAVAAPVYVAPRKSIENLSNIYRTSIENLLNIYRKYIENNRIAPTCDF